MKGMECPLYQGHNLVKPCPVFGPVLHKFASDHAGQVGWLMALSSATDGSSPHDLGFAAACTPLHHLLHVLPIPIAA